LQIRPTRKELLQLAAFDVSIQERSSHISSGPFTVRVQKCLIDYKLTVPPIAIKLYGAGIAANKIGDKQEANGYFRNYCRTQIHPTAAERRPKK
jgi:hypothetical protein